MPVHEESAAEGCADEDLATACTAAALVSTAGVGALVAALASIDASARASVATTAVVEASAVVVVAAATAAVIVEAARAVVAVASSVVEVCWVRLASGWFCGDCSGDWTWTRSGSEGHAPSEG
jgi:hypothetical protein